VLGVLLTACQAIARELHPFLPDAATRIEHALEQRDPDLGRTLFSKVVVAARRPGQGASDDKTAPICRSFTGATGVDP
jgi:hypothetical protein